MSGRHDVATLWRHLCLFRWFSGHGGPINGPIAFKLDNYIDIILTHRLIAEKVSGRHDVATLWRHLCLFRSFSGHGGPINGPIAFKLDTYTDIV